MSEMAIEHIRQRDYDGWLRFKRKFIYPFRWFYENHLWCLGFRLRCVRLFASAVWHWDSCDYGPTLRMMEIAFREIAKSHEHNKLVMGWERTARETRIAAELCRRLEQDDYYELATNDLNKGRGLRYVKHTEYLARQDAEYFGRMFRKVRTWWH